MALPLVYCSRRHRRHQRALGRIDNRPPIPVADLRSSDYMTLVVVSSSDGRGNANRLVRRCDGSQVVVVIVMDVSRALLPEWSLSLIFLLMSARLIVRPDGPVRGAVHECPRSAGSERWDHY